MHYSRHHLTTSATTWLRSRTRQPMASIACPACPLVSSSKTKPCQFSSVQFSYVTMYAPLVLQTLILKVARCNDKIKYFKLKLATV